MSALTTIGRQTMFIRPNGSNKQIYYLIIALVCFFGLSSCENVNFGVNDWKYDKLPNGYEIWRINSQDIVLGKFNDISLDRVIDRYIIEFCYNDTYICVKQLAIDEDIPYEDVDVSKLDYSNPDYYIVNTSSDTVYGPYNFSGYEQQCKDLNIVKLSKWIKTVPTPKDAKPLGT